MSSRNVGSTFNLSALRNNTGGDIWPNQSVADCGMNAASDRGHEHLAIFVAYVRKALAINVVKGCVNVFYVHKTSYYVDLNSRGV